jgi:hypothetical protein
VKRHGVLEDSKGRILLQNRLVDISVWCLLAAWVVTPWISVINYKRPHFGTAIVCALSSVPFLLSCVGNIISRIRTRWFYLPSTFAVLTFCMRCNPVIACLS